MSDSPNRINIGVACKLSSILTLLKRLSDLCLIRHVDHEAKPDITEATSDSKVVCNLEVRQIAEAMQAGSSQLAECRVQV